MVLRNAWGWSKSKPESTTPAVAARAAADQLLVHVLGVVGPVVAGDLGALILIKV